jgi:hypothetical protein
MTSGSHWSATVGAEAVRADWRCCWASWAGRWAVHWVAGAAKEAAACCWRAGLLAGLRGLRGWLLGWAAQAGAGRGKRVGV